MNNIMQNKKFTEISGWVGLACLQFNSVPAIMSSLETGETTPIGTILLTMAGLSLYLIRSIATNDTHYTQWEMLSDWLETQFY